MLSRLRSCTCLLLFAFLFAWSFPASAQQQAPVVQWNASHALSQPLGVLAKTHPYRAHRPKHELNEHNRIPLPMGIDLHAQDPAIQHTASPQLTPPPSENFEAQGAGLAGFSPGGTPPDTDGAVGTTQYLQIVNSSITVFSKTGAVLSGPTNTNTIFSSLGGGCASNDDGDGVVLYDKLANRWVVTQFSVTTTPYLECVAVSTSNDATGTYNLYAFQFSNFPDYPKIGVWPDAYYMTYNMFNGNTFVGADACAIDRNAMLSGQSAQMVCFQQGSSVGGMLPSDMDGTAAPPAGSKNYFMTYGSNSLNLYRFHVDFVNTNNSTFTGPTVIGVAAFSPLCGGGTCVPQASTSNQLDSLADRLMFRLGYRNYGTREALYVSHSVTAGSGGGVRWYEINNPAVTPTVAQQGTFAPDSNFRWMPSIASDSSGDIAVGYSVSSSSIFPSISYAGRVPGDPAGTLESEISVHTGTGAETVASRWGDYSAMTIDPTDDCTFWYTDEYYASTGEFNWNTRVASFKFPGCGTSGSPGASLSPTSLNFGTQTVGTTSSAQAITLTNTGTATLSISSITTSGDFAETNTCGSSLNAGANCAINVTFTPTVVGTRNGTLTVNDNAPGSPQTASLTGIGQSAGSPGASLTPTSLTFGSQAVGTTSAAQAITLKNTGTVTLTITSIASTGDFAQTNACGSSLAANATCAINITFTPTAVGTRTGTLSVTDNATGSPQTASLTGTGTSGGGGGQTAVYNSTLKAPTCATVGISCDSGPTLILGTDNMSGGPEPNQPNTINNSCTDGTSGSFHSDESNDRILVATTDGSNLAPGKTVKVTATVWAYSDGSQDALDLYYASNANSPVWTPIQTSIVPAGGGAQAISATYTLPSGSLQAVRANFRYQGSASSCSTGSYDDHDDLIFAVGGGTPNFTVSASPSSLTVAQGSNITSTITVTSQNSFSAATTLTATGLPGGVTAAFSPNPITPASGGTATSTLTLTASSSATTGTSTVTVTGTAGALVNSTTISLTVTTSGGGAQTAVYSTTLKAPTCAAVGSSCDSGPTLLLGKDNMSGGAETHQPNTINNSCSDGTSGTFHSDESNDRLLIASTDGTSLTHGKTAKVTATVWAWNTGSADALDLYYAANANSPTWVFITTIVPPAGGAQALSATFTLPTGSLQAVRANFRYQGSKSSCSKGSYDDHDDLVFAVQ